MSKLKKLVSVLLAVAICFGMTTTVFADGTETGSITINSSGTVSVEGKTFNAYRILDLTLTGADDLDTTDVDERGYVYTVPSALKSFYADYFNISADVGDFSAQVRDAIAALSSNSDDLFAFATAALAAAKDAGLTAYTATGESSASSVTISNLPLGYYVVEDAGGGTNSTISALMMDSTNETVVITLKADEPPLEKVIVLTEDDPDTADVDEETTGDTNNAAVGDIIPYELTSTVPDMTGYTKYYFVVTDTLSAGLTYNEDMEITIIYTDENNVEQTITLKDSTDTAVTSGDTNLYDLTVTENTDGTTTLEIVFKNFIQYKNIAGATITINYSATLNENAVIGSAGNDNTAALTYSNNPNYSDDNTSDKPDDDVPTGETPDAKTTTYVTGVKLTKVNDAGDTLAGATFTLTGTAANKVQVTGEFYVADENGTYWKLTDGTYTTTAPVTTGGTDDTSSYYNSITQKYSKTTSAWVETTGTDAVTATATSNADGVLTFNGLAEGTYTITEIVAPDGYNLLTDSIEITISWTAPDNGAGTACTWTVTGDATVNSNGIIELTVENQAGTILPSTGGMGTTLFYIVGGILVFGAAVLLITRRRMNRAE